METGFSQYESLRKTDMGFSLLSVRLAGRLGLQEEAFVRNIRASLENINRRLYFSLLAMGFVPTLYSTFRVFLLGSLPGDWSFSIAGQLSWVSLIYEVLNEAIILPLYFFMGDSMHDKRDFSNRVKTGLLVSFFVYGLCSLLIFRYADGLLVLMAANKEIIKESAAYVRIESVANVFSIMAGYLQVCLVSLGKSRSIYVLTVLKLLLCVVFDVFLVSALPLSLNFGVNGIGYSNILANLVMFAASLALLSKEGVCVFKRDKLSFSWMGGFFKIGSLSGLESLVRNAAYMVMISRMVNIVNEQGTYWVANSFVWGYLLLPILQLGELIKQQTGANKNSVGKSTAGYLYLTVMICAAWFVTLPLWKPFMKNILLFSDVEKLYGLTALLAVFYVFFALQNVFDSEFYGLGKTSCLLLESVITNFVYYGTAFVLYVKGFWVPSLMGIAYLFGFGNVFDSLITFAIFAYYAKKNGIRFTTVKCNR